MKAFSLLLQELCDITVAEALAANLYSDRAMHLKLILCTLEDIARGVAFIHSNSIIHGRLYIPGMVGYPYPILTPECMHAFVL